MDGQQDSPDTPWQFKPGDTVVPGQAPNASPAPVAAAESEPAVATLPAPEEPAAPGSALSSNAPQSATEHSVSWTASEFIAHSKSLSWYLLLAGAAVLVAAIIWLLTKDKISTGVVIVGAIVLGAYGARQPRQLGYKLDASGLTIGNRYHSYDEFRSFAIVDEGAFASIMFLPLKRFAPLTTIYYDPTDEENIVALLADRLPMEDRQHDVVDRFLHRIRY